MIIMYLFQEERGFHGGSDSKESAWNAGEYSSITGLGRSIGEGNGNLFQYSWLEKSKDRGAWWATYSPWDLKELDTTEQLTYFKMKKDEWLKLRVD